MLLNCDKWILEWKLDAKKKKMTDIFYKAYLQDLHSCPLSPNDISVDEFLFKETQIFLY